MHNWWISTMEHLGLLTREEAQHLSQEIKLKIHKDNYGEAFREVENVLSQGHFMEKLKNVEKLEQRVKTIEARLDKVADLASAELHKAAAKKEVVAKK